MPAELILLFSYLLLGCVAGFISGLLGVGGGLIVVPALIFIFTQFDVIPSPQLMHMVIATSLACSIVNLLSALRTHYHYDAVRWPVFFSMAPGVIIGALFLGPAIFLWINPKYLVIGFGLFCFLSAGQMFLKRKTPMSQEKLPNRISLFSMGAVAAAVSTLIGIAGGVMISTILYYSRLEMPKAIGTSTAICVVLAISGTVGLMFVGYHQPDLPPWSTGYIYWPAFLSIAFPSLFLAPVGAALTHKLPVPILKKLFACLLLVVGVKMLV